MKQVKFSELPQNEFKITVATTATGASTLSASVDGITSSYTTVAAETSDSAAYNWSRSLRIDLGSAYTVLKSADSEITVSAVNGRRLRPVFVTSADATQTATGSGWWLDTAIWSGATAKAFGAPATAGGWAIGEAADSDLTLVLLRLNNQSGGAKAANFSVWTRERGGTWAVDITLGTAGVISLTNSGVAAHNTDVEILMSTYADEIAVELIDDAAGGALVGCSASAWVATL